MKKYEKIAYVRDTDHDVFLDNTSKRIDEYQECGLQVEVQYSTENNLSTALILGFREETQCQKSI